MLFDIDPLVADAEPLVAAVDPLVIFDVVDLSLKLEERGFTGGGVTLSIPAAPLLVAGVTLD